MNTQQYANKTVMAANSCPFCSKETYVCLASLWSFAVDIRRHNAFCGTEDFDDCPIFLGKSLRMAKEVFAA